MKSTAINAKLAVAIFITWAQILPDYPERLVNSVER
jgi:hypothetical protein